MRMCVDEAGQQYVIRAIDNSAGLVTLARLAHRQDIDDFAVINSDGMVAQYVVGRLDRHTPAGQDESVAILHQSLA